MFAVIFEVRPKADKFKVYLDLAKFLKPKLEAIEGFIDNERFESKRRTGCVLSLSTWADEKAVIRWRTEREHHGVQEKGRFEVFEDYHLRVGEITADTQPGEGTPVQGQRFDATEIGEAKVVAITELEPREKNKFGFEADQLALRLGLRPGSDGLIDQEAFESIYNPGKLLLLAGWRDAAAATAWLPQKPDAGASLRHRHVRVIRDYGMFDRREAPQFYPDVTRAAGAAPETRGRAAR
jgi:heme-degrading monooxygenase HmoA